MEKKYTKEDLKWAFECATDQDPGYENFNEFFEANFSDTPLYTEEQIKAVLDEYSDDIELKYVKPDIIGSLKYHVNKK
jgi:hypothetical protein